MKHKSNNLTNTRILTFVLLGFILLGCSTDNETVKRKLQLVTENYFNSTNKRPNIDSLKAEKISIEIYDNLSKSIGNSKILKLLDSQKSSDLEKVEDLIYYYSFPIAYDSRHTILSDTSQLFFLANLVEFYTPTIQDYRHAEDLLIKELKNKSSEYLTMLDTLTIRNYYRQYSFYRQSNNDSMVYINGLCEILEYPSEINGEIIWKPFNWREELISVNDGGDCYWQILINLTTGKVEYLMINGVA